MTQTRDQARAGFLRTMRLIVLCGVALVIAVLLFLGLTGELYLHMVIATVAGVFISVVLGCGLFALAFFSDRSGHDADVTQATHHRPDDPR